jgi:rod shape-determining protein MreC
MLRLLSFLRRIYVLLIFLVLEGLALHFYANSTTVTKARILTASNKVVGGIYSGLSGVEHFFSLGTTNRLLETRVGELENELAAYRERFSAEQLDSIVATAILPYEYVVAHVVRNSVGNKENYLMVDKGTRDGIEKGMAVVSLDGYMVGYVESCSAGNAICVSALNTSFRASGSVKGTDHFGSLSWPGTGIRHIALAEVPKYAPISRGDTIVTTSYSFYFPEGILIGTIEDFEVEESTASYNIDVRLGVDISALRDVLLIKNPEVYERIRLEEEVLGTPTE